MDSQHDDDEKTCFLCMASLGGKDDASCDSCPIRACTKDHLSVHQAKENDKIICLPFRVGRDKTKGRHFLATRDIAPLELVLTDRPSVVGPPTVTKPTCLGCLDPLTQLMFRCPRCKFPLCENCFKVRDKTWHSEEECSYLASYGSKIVDPKEEYVVYAAVFILRCLLLKRDNPGEYARVTNLMAGDTSDLLNSLGKKVFKILKDVLKVTWVSKAEVVTLMGIKRTNSNVIPGEKRGNALYPTYPLMNSLCFCNTFAHVSTSGEPTIEVRAQRAIKRQEEISTRYTTSFECQPGRQRKIWSHWRFLCECRLCADPTERGTFFSAVKCRNCPSGFLLPCNISMLSPPWSCTRCQRKEGPTAIVDRVEKCKNVLEDRCLSNKEKLSLLLDELHPNHQLVFAAKQAVLFARGDYKNLRKDEKALIERIKLAKELLVLVETFDPGYTVRKGRLLKVLVKDRVDLAKLKRDKYGDENVWAEDQKRSAAELSEMVQCLKYQT